MLLPRTVCVVNHNWTSELLIVFTKGKSYCTRILLLFNYILRYSTFHCSTSFINRLCNNNSTSDAIIVFPTRRVWFRKKKNEYILYFVVGLLGQTSTQYYYNIITYSDVVYLFNILYFFFFTFATVYQYIYLQTYYGART